MANYLVKKEYGLPLLKAAAADAFASKDIVAVELATDLKVETLCGEIKNNATAPTAVQLTDGDAVIFELYSCVLDASVWIGLSAFERAVENVLGTGNITVVPFVCGPNS